MPIAGGAAGPLLLACWFAIGVLPVAGPFGRSIFIHSLLVWK